MNKIDDTDLRIVCRIYLISFMKWNGISSFMQVPRSPFSLYSLQINLNKIFYLTSMVLLSLIAINTDSKMHKNMNIYGISETILNV